MKERNVRSWGQPGDATRDQLRGPNYQRLYRNAYVPAGEAASIQTRLAAALATVGGGVLSDTSAAWCFDIPLPLDVSPVEPVHVTIQAPQRKRHQRNLTIHSRDIEGRVVEIRGFPATDAIRTWFDLARHYSGVDLIAMTDSFLQKRHATYDELAAAVRNHAGHPGARNAAFALERADGGAESWWESMFRLALLDAGVLVTTQVEICDADGEPFAYSDLGIAELKIAIEFDGRHHFAETQQRKDVRRVQQMQREGWIVLRYTAADLTRRMPQVIDEVRRNIAARRNRAA